MLDDVAIEPNRLPSGVQAWFMRRCSIISRLVVCDSWKLGKFSSRLAVRLPLLLPIVGLAPSLPIRSHSSAAYSPRRPPNWASAARKPSFQGGGLACEALLKAVGRRAGMDAATGWRRITSRPTEGSTFTLGDLHSEDTTELAGRVGNTFEKGGMHECADRGRSDMRR